MNTLAVNRNALGEFGQDVHTAIMLVHNQLEAIATEPLLLTFSRWTEHVLACSVDTATNDFDARVFITNIHRHTDRLRSLMTMIASVTRSATRAINAFIARTRTRNPGIQQLAAIIRVCSVLLEAGCLQHGVCIDLGSKQRAAALDWAEVRRKVATIRMRALLALSEMHGSLDVAAPTTTPPATTWLAFFVAAVTVHTAFMSQPMRLVVRTVPSSPSAELVREVSKMVRAVLSITSAASSDGDNGLRQQLPTAAAAPAEDVSKTMNIFWLNGQRPEDVKPIFPWEKWDKSMRIIDSINYIEREYKDAMTAFGVPNLFGGEMEKSVYAGLSSLDDWDPLRSLQPLVIRGGNALTSEEINKPGGSSGNLMVAAVLEDMAAAMLHTKAQELETSTQMALDRNAEAAGLTPAQRAANANVIMKRFEEQRDALRKSLPFDYDWLVQQRRANTAAVDRVMTQARRILPTQAQMAAMPSYDAPLALPQLDEAQVSAVVREVREVDDDDARRESTEDDDPYDANWEEVLRAVESGEAITEVTVGGGEELVAVDELTAGFGQQRVTLGDGSAPAPVVADAANNTPLVRYMRQLLGPFAQDAQTVFATSRGALDLPVGVARRVAGIVTAAMLVFPGCERSIVVPGAVSVALHRASATADTSAATPPQEELQEQQIVTSSSAADGPKWVPWEGIDLPAMRPDIVKSVTIRAADGRVLQRCDKARVCMTAQEAQRGYRRTTDIPPDECMLFASWVAHGRPPTPPALKTYTMQYCDAPLRIMFCRHDASTPKHVLRVVDCIDAAPGTAAVRSRAPTNVVIEIAPPSAWHASCAAFVDLEQQ